MTFEALEVVILDTVLLNQMHLVIQQSARAA